jgi:hypothetical protein
VTKPVNGMNNSIRNHNQLMLACSVTGEDTNRVSTAELLSLAWFPALSEVLTSAIAPPVSPLADCIKLVFKNITHAIVSMPSATNVVLQLNLDLNILYPPCSRLAIGFLFAFHYLLQSQIFLEIDLFGLVLA